MNAVVIGYGNMLRGDDGAGPAVAEAIAARGLPGVRVLSVTQLTPELAELLAEVKLAVFVDATAERVGDVTVQPVRPAQRAESLGHTSNSGILLALAGAIYGASPEAWIVRVPAESFTFGEGLSHCARQAIGVAVEEIIRLFNESEALATVRRAAFRR